MNFITLSPECRNIELVKDVGQIPYVLGRTSDINTAIVECKVDEKGFNMEYVEELNLIHIPYLFHNNSLSGLAYLLKHASKIDWLSLHHAGRRSLYWTKIYKKLNPKGKVYLKLDLDFRSCEMYDKDEKERELFHQNTQIVDLLTVETKAVKDRIQKYSAKPIEILGNGFCKPDFEVYRSQKQNAFISVGRLGTEQKATDVLLNAFAQSSSAHDWDLYLVGSVEPEFQTFISEYFVKYPELKSRVHLLGSINDRQKLYDLYCKSKVFLLPSRWESFALVGGEALYCGCKIIASDNVPSAPEFTNNGLYGDIFRTDDVDALSSSIIKATQDTYSKKEIDEIVAYSQEKFSWEKICRELYKLLKER